MNKFYNRYLFTRIPGLYKHLFTWQSGGQCAVHLAAVQIYPLGSDKLTDLQFFISASCQPGSQGNNLY